VVEHAPSRYLLTFSEPASPLALKLVKPDGGSIALDLYQLRDRTVEIEAPSSLSRGTHVLSWRVVSEDGHPIGGSVVFSIGEASVQAPAVENQIDWRVRGGLWLSKLALYVGLFMGVGGVFAKAVLMPRLASGRRFVGAALVIGAGGAILSGGFQGLDALAAPAQNFLDPIVWSAGLTTT
jgi:copper transport protein